MASASAPRRPSLPTETPPRRRRSRGTDRPCGRRWGSPSPLRLARLCRGAPASCGWGSRRSEATRPRSYEPTAVRAARSEDGDVGADRDASGVRGARSAAGLLSPSRRPLRRPAAAASLSSLPRPHSGSAVRSRRWQSAPCCPLAAPRLSRVGGSGPRFRSPSARTARVARAGLACARGLRRCARGDIRSSADGGTGGSRRCCRCERAPAIVRRLSGSLAAGSVCFSAASSALGVSRVGGARCLLAWCLAAGGRRRVAPSASSCPRCVQRGLAAAVNLGHLGRRRGGR